MPTPTPSTKLPLAAASTLYEGQVLMIDADDTLWENNIYFEEAINRFIELVAHPELTPQEVRTRFDAFESVRVKIHGYGTGAFHASLLAGYAHLTGAACTAAHKQGIAACADFVRSGVLSLLNGVSETLPYLAARHKLLLVTKGDHAEQTDKLQRSGLAHHFAHVEVLREKHVSAYEELLHRYSFDPASTWMIGNSPRSDTNPALRAGMHAVYLPHPSTWVLEQEPVAAPASGRELLHLSSFHELRLHF